MDGIRISHAGARDGYIGDSADATLSPGSSKHHCRTTRWPICPARLRDWQATFWPAAAEGATTFTTEHCKPWASTCWVISSALRTTSLISRPTSLILWPSAMLATATFAGSSERPVRSEASTHRDAATATLRSEPAGACRARRLRCRHLHVRIQAGLHELGRLPGRLRRDGVPDPTGRIQHRRARAAFHGCSLSAQRHVGNIPGSSEGCSRPRREHRCLEATLDTERAHVSRVLVLTVRAPHERVLTPL